MMQKKQREKSLNKVKNVDPDASPFDVKWVHMNIKSEDIVKFIHEGRREV